MDKYHVLDLIGEGSFGRVYKGRKKLSGQVVALKFIAKTGRSEKDLKNLRREIEIMQGLHNDNIIQMLDSFETDKEVVAVTDYAEGELFQILEDDGSLPEEQVQAIACQLVSALYYLHSHRILHRDMKPQNILLGKGGVVKLCDFGFARSMSMNTLVLTSIKGTPLYMSPELVEEQPYDHTADLWALGCILYELFTGTPPFYTNSIFQLVSLIIKDPVKWPKNMSPVFKDFLQGLLTKNPRNRLQWPDLYQHQFVADGVKVSEEDKNLLSPFTTPPTASVVLAKEKQTKEKAHPPGTSKILSKARRKAAEEDAKRTKTRKVESAGKERNDEKQHPATTAAAAAVAVVPPQPQSEKVTTDWTKTGVSQAVNPTPRPDRISKDYAQECPSIEIESRKVIKKSSKDHQKTIENVKLDGEDVDSDDEWQGYVDLTDVANEPDPSMALMDDQKFVNRLQTRLNKVSAQVLEGMLDGASKLRPMSKIITNLITLKCDLNILTKFMKCIDIPGLPYRLLSQILDSAKVKQQPWCQQILLDQVITLNAYFASEIVWNESADKACLQAYYDMAIKFLQLCPKLLGQKLDEDLKLQEQTILCIIYLCETLERSHSRSDTANKFFSSIASKAGNALEAILNCTMADSSKLKKLEEIAGNSELANNRLNDMTSLAIAGLASLCHFPHEADIGLQGKRKVALYVGELLSEKRLLKITDCYLNLISREDTCSSVLKVVYSACQMSSKFCQFICNKREIMQKIIDILLGKLEIADMELNTILEMVLHILSTVVVQLQLVPTVLAENAGLIVSIFLESQIASHTAASALLFSQLIYCGCAVEVQPEEMLMAALSSFTDLTQILVRCPFDYGIFDGVLLLMCQLLMQAEGPIARAILDCGLWTILWHRLVQMLQVRNPDTNKPIHDIEADEQIDVTCMPDWGLISPQGLLASLQLAVSVFTKESHHCVPAMAKSDSIVTLTLMYLMSKEFLDLLCKSPVTADNGKQLANDILLEACQLICFPFAIDIEDELLMEVYSALYKCNFVPKLLQSCQNYVKTEQLEMPIGIIARLVLGDIAFVDQFASSVQTLNATEYFLDIVGGNSVISVISDLVSIFSHLCRCSPQHADLVITIVQGNKGDFFPLLILMQHKSAVIRSRMFNMIGNIMKHSDSFYTVLRDRERIRYFLLTSLDDEDVTIRKSGVYAMGNACFHNDTLYSHLQPMIPKLVKMLHDHNSKIRCHSASALGNLGMHSNKLSESLIKHKVPNSLLEKCCHDNSSEVQECCLTALRTLSDIPEIRQALNRIGAQDKLSQLVHTSTPRPSTGGSHRSVSASAIPQHCGRLIQQLKAIRT
ncbi:serine/threonine-protein kinase 36-like [Tubulanus polymorphus]|uniref:serine/threonine-protein kinase 36-like n=1 Tax=Tubulanus polymorphus TaxID=672921 RepID=UPI003DA469D1